MNSRHVMPAARADRSNASLAQPRPHRRGGDADAEAFQLTNDALVAPSRVLAGEAEHQRANIPPNRSATTSAAVRPALRDQPAMPAKQRRGRDQERVPAGAREQSTRGCQEDPVYGRDRRPTGLTPKDRELVSQHQNLEILEVM